MRRILSFDELHERMGSGRSKKVFRTYLWRLYNRRDGNQDSTFPAPVKISANRVGWFEDEVAAFLESLPRSVAPTPNAAA